MSKLNYNNVLLTGATGLLGSWVAEKLLLNNVNLTGVAIDNSKDDLLKFKEKAEYEDGRETDLTGKEAYSIYGKEVVEHLKKVGANWVLSGKVSRLMIGEAEDLWDSVAIARYPSRKAMFEMIMDPDYLESEKHRSAGLEGQLNIELKEGELL